MNGQAPTLPKFREIAEQLRKRILGGELPPGEEIPSERALALEYGISRPTATRALELLRHEGLVYSVQGSGTFVADLAISRRPSDRYQRSRNAGRIYSDGERAEIVSAELVERPPEHVANALRIGPKVAAIRRRRVIWKGDVPVEVSTSWFSASLAATAPRLLSTERIRPGTVAYVEEASGRQATYARDRMSARAAGAEDARSMKLAKVTAPVLAVEHTVFDQRDEPLEFVEAVYPPGRWTHEQRYDLL
ncbi:GntR family transcriptional regulator [Terrabacter sp. GCM10028922]|uniref:GntR family transcriptional regulator n=1 Tax=Terrabacter sp. GCM10028922 TaxID=3273428 RepID=UPI003612DC52